MSEPRRVESYPVFVEQPLRLYVSPDGDLVAMMETAATRLGDIARDVCGVDVTVKKIYLGQGNAEDETWDVVVLGAMFSNVTRPEIDHYRDLLAEALVHATGEEPQHRLVSDGKARNLPTPDVFVPDSDYIEDMRQRNRSVREFSQDYNPDGTPKNRDRAGKAAGATGAADSAASTSAAQPSQQADATETSGERPKVEDLF